MTTPFREAAESPSATAITRLMSLRAHPVRSLCARYGWYRESTRARPREGELAWAKEAGFTSLGNLAEGTLPIYRKRVLVDGARTTQVQLSPRGYFFVTYFESGQCIITWNHEPQTPSTNMLQSRGTCGSITGDYDAHLAAVKALSASEAPIVVSDLRAAVMLGTIYYRQIVPLGLAVVTLIVPFMLMGVVALAVMTLMRRH